MIPFPFNENRFPFFFVADYLLVGQLYTNPKSDRSLFIMSESDTMFNERDQRCAAVQTHALYRSKLWQQDHCQRPQNAKSGFSRIIGKCPGWWKQSFLATVMFFGVVSSEGPHHPTSHLQSRLESQHQSVPGRAEECSDPLVQSGGRWQTPGLAEGLGAGPQVQRDPGLASEGVLRLCTLLSHPSSPQLEPRWTTPFGHMSRTSQTWPATTPKLAWSPPSTEYSPTSQRCLGKRQAPNFGSVSKWCLRAAKLNRCQLYYIIKLAELIFSIKVLKWSCRVVFFRTTILSFYSNTFGYFL